MPYIGDLADIPNGWHLCDGTDGTPNLLDNRFLEGSATIGTFKEPGLPNITGYIDAVLWNNTPNGAFRKYSNQSINFYSSDHGWLFFTGGANFNASWSNSIYGASSTVQPRSYTVLYIMKIA